MCVAARAVGRERRERRGRAARTPRFASRHPLHARPCTVPRPAAAAARRGGRPMRAARGAAPAAQRRPPPSPPLPRPGRAWSRPAAAAWWRPLPAPRALPTTPPPPPTRPAPSCAPRRRPMMAPRGPWRTSRCGERGLGGRGRTRRPRALPTPHVSPSPAPLPAAPRRHRNARRGGRPRVRPGVGPAAAGVHGVGGGWRLLGREKKAAPHSRFVPSSYAPPQHPSPQLPPALARRHRGRALGGGHRVPVRRGDRAAGFG